MVFPSIQETYLATVRWFKENPEFQLIVKTHPDEENPKIPRTVEQVKGLIENAFGVLPPNILVTRPRSTLTAYSLFEWTQVSIVSTTTAGLESPIFGVPTVTLGNPHYRGKGFTFDPKSEEEYLQLLKKLLQERWGDSQKKITRETALRYFYTYMFRFFRNMGLVTLSWDERVPKVFPNNLSQMKKLTEFQNLVSAIVKEKMSRYEATSGISQNFVFGCNGISFNSVVSLFTPPFILLRFS